MITRNIINTIFNIAPMLLSFLIIYQFFYSLLEIFHIKRFAYKITGA